MKMFRLLGASERQGFGGPLIYKTAVENHLRTPEIESDLEHTELRVWSLDLIDSYPDLSEEEKSVLRIVVKSIRPVSINEVEILSRLTDYRIRKNIEHLEEMELLVKVGNGKATKYTVAPSRVEAYTQLQIAMEELRKRM